MQISWLPISKDSDFSIHNLPVGIFATTMLEPRVCVAIGDRLIDLAAAYDLGFFSRYRLLENVFNKPYLNDFISLGSEFTQYVRVVLQEALLDEGSLLKRYESDLLYQQQEVQMRMPILIGNYTDFYSCEEHATHVGKLFRPDDPLFPNWKHLPVAYHGRASSIVVSGTEIHRPQGQIYSKDNAEPVFIPTQALDYELELGFVVGKDSVLGNSISVNQAEEYIFGVVLFNDWSARDIQRWEYQPLGPFTSKNFASSMSPWVVTLDALKLLRSKPLEQSPKPLPYLYHLERKGFDLSLTVSIQPINEMEFKVSQTNAQYLYWNISQQVAHHTVTGCNLNVGDLLATGTISGPERTQAGCLLEATAGGKHPLLISDKVSRSFLEDGDEVIFRGYGQNEAVRIGFGELRGKILPAIKNDFA
jgi:fumarylacetoacetase